MANPKRIQGVISGTTEVGRHTRSSPPKRPTPDDFINMVYHPQDHKILISEYVGTDSKYTLAKKHAGMMIRSSVKSQDIAGRTREVAEPLSAIDTFLGSLLDYQALKPEQRGCVALRICFGALTALLGESSQGTSVETFVSDSHASVIPREHLSDFRSFNPDLHHILCELSSKLEKCINLYRHRRCPSSSLVAKFQEMSDTLELWNRHLMDDTFAVPSRIVSDWLKNHPTQVDSRRRNQAYSRRYSPDFSGINRPSPTQWDSNYLSPMSAYGEPSRPSKKYGVRSTSIDRSDQYDTLFKPSTGVTYFGSNRPAYASTSYNPKPYHTTDFAGGINLSQSMDEAWDTCLSRLSLQ